MLKGFSILALLLLSIFTWTQESYAYSRLTHERFVHLSLAQKKEIIKGTMKLIVEIESRYKYEVQKRGFSKERLKKFTSIMKSFQEFILSSAHAEIDPAYTSQINQFVQILQRSDRCLYGGWPSEMRNGHCTHPANLSRSSRERKAYLASGCRQPQEISCNPLIFGYKQQRKSSLFCVPAGKENDNAHNAALNCMRKALDEPNEGDAADARLEWLARQLEGNREAARKMHEFITRACVCSNPPRGLNQNYHSYMRPHRTCYGLMQTIGKASAACTTPPVEAENLIMIQALQAAVAAPESSSTQIDEFYSTYLNDLADTDEFERFCGPSSDRNDNSGAGNDPSDNDEDGNTSGDNNTGRVTTGANGGDSSINPQGGNQTQGSNGGQGTQGRDPLDQTGDQPGPQGEASGGSGGGLVVSDSPDKPGVSAGGAGGGNNNGNSSGNNPGTTTTGQAGGGAGPGTNPDPGTNTETTPDSTSQYQVSVAQEDPTSELAVVSATTTPAELPADVTLVWYATGSDLSNLTPPTVVTPAAEAEETPAPAAAAEEGEAPATPAPASTEAPITNLTEVRDNPAAEAEKRFEVVGKKISIARRETDFQMCAKLVRNGVVVSNTSCTTISKVPAQAGSDDDSNNDSDNDTFILSLSNSVNKSNVKVTATIKDQASIPDGVTIVWYSRSTPASSTPARGSAGDIPAEGQPKETPRRQTLEELTSSGVQKREGSTLEITVDQKDVSFQMCAQVFRGSNSVSNEACSEIPKKKEKPAKSQQAPAGGGMQMPMGPQLPPPIRGGGDMILRGVY